MRLLIVIFLAVLLAVLAGQDQQYQLATPAQARLVDQRVGSNIELARRDSQPVNASEVPPSAEKWDWLWLAVNKVLLFVLAGWGVGRVLTQFRRWFLIIFGVLVIFNFLLTQTGLVEVTFHYENLDAVFAAFKVWAMRVGWVEVISFVLGLWAGVSGVLSTEKPSRLATA